MQTQIEIKEENFKQALQQVKDELKEGKESELQQLQVQILELKEKNEELFKSNTQKTSELSQSEV